MLTWAVGVDDWRRREYQLLSRYVDYREAKEDRRGQEFDVKLYNRTIYGLRALVDLAYHGGDEPMRVCEMAERGAIPGPFLEQIFQDLRAADLVASKRGPGGGYRLVSAPEEVTLECVLEALDNGPSMPELEEATMMEATAEIADSACEELVARITELAKSVTLADLVERGEEQGLARKGYEGFIYVI